MLTAIEALLVSLYGYRPTDDPQPVLATSPSPAAPQQDNEHCIKRNDVLSNHSGNSHKDAPVVISDASLDLPTSNSNSSSSVADDWIVNQIPAAPESNFSLCEDQSCAQTAEAESASKSPESLEDNVVSKDQFSAEDWSRGMALTDPVTKEPLQPVKIHQPSRGDHSDAKEGQGNPGKKMLNAITEKRAALTAYDLISNRAMRAPPSPAALFEKEARAVVLREKPAASLQEISDTVHERWKNLREEERKK